MKSKQFVSRVPDGNEVWKPTTLFIEEKCSSGRLRGRVGLPLRRIEDLVASHARPPVRRTEAT